MQSSDDTAFLEVFEAFLQDDLVLGDGASSSRDQKPTVSDSESSRSDARATPKKPPVMNRSRMRLRMKILSLREQVVALESELAAAKRGVSSSKESSTCDSSPWKALVKCQAERLQASERERQDLRERVRECKRVIRRLHRFFRVLKISSVGIDLRYNIRVTQSGEDCVPRELESTSRHLEWMYSVKDAIFTDARVDSVGINGFDRIIHFDHTPNMSIEMFASWQLPFSVHETASATWQHHLTKTTKMTLAADEDLMETDHSIRRSYLVEVAFSRFKCFAQGHMETRRIVEGNRVVVLQYTLNFLSSDSIHVKGLGIQNRTWTIIEPPRNQFSPNSNKPVCQVLTFQQRELVFSGPEAVHQGASARHEIRRYCLDAGDFALSSERNGVESILMNEI